MAAPHDHTPWQVLHQQVIHDAYPWVRLSMEGVRLPNGHHIEDFYRVDIAPYVMMFAVDEGGRVALVEHYKHGPQSVSLELPAGYIEESEGALGSAQRELREETGLISDDWLDLGRYFIDGNRGCGWMYGFLARNARSLGTLEHEASEIMTLHFKTLDEVFALWQANHFINVAAAALVGRCLLELGYVRKA